MTLKLAYVLSSPLKKDTPIKLKAFSKKLEFDTFYLSKEPREKILKKDVDLDLSVLNDYDIVCPVGAEALKYTCGLTGILKYAGQVVEEKYIPIIDPNMLAIKPQFRADLQKCFDKVNSVASGEVPMVFEKDYAYIDTAEAFLPYLEQLKAAETIVCDIETTALSARKGTVIGVALSTRPHQGIFVSCEVIEEFYDEVDTLFRTKPTVLHNAKFDVQFLYKQLKFEFPLFEDTILMHYCLDETVGSHGLKQLAMKFTDLGDYDKDLHEYI